MTKKQVRIVFIFNKDSYKRFLYKFTIHGVPFVLDAKRSTRNNAALMSQCYYKAIIQTDSVFLKVLKVLQLLLSSSMRQVTLPTNIVYVWLLFVN